MQAGNTDVYTPSASGSLPNKAHYVDGVLEHRIRLVATPGNENVLTWTANSESDFQFTTCYWWNQLSDYLAFDGSNVYTRECNQWHSSNYRITIR